MKVADLIIMVARFFMTVQAMHDRKAAKEAFVKCVGLREKSDFSHYFARPLDDYSKAISDISPNESYKRLQQATAVLRKLGATNALDKAQAKSSAPN